LSDFHRGFISLAEAEAKVGSELGVSRWFEISQDRIDAFADATEDWLFIHTDPEQAAREAPYEGTIAHGFLTASLLAAMAYDALPRVEGAPRGVNYGFDRLRFLTPVRAGSRIRGRFNLSRLDASRPGEVTLHYAVTVEIEGEERPALVADWITRQYFGTD
jgi:acyl dehydratase